MNMLAMNICRTRYHLALCLILSVGCVPVTSPKLTSEKVVAEKKCGERLPERIVQKTFEVKWFTPVHPDALPISKTQYNRYYLREKDDRELNDVQREIDGLIDSHKPELASTYEHFIPVEDCRLWICLVQEIVNANSVNTLVIILDGATRRSVFLVKDCLRNKGNSGWAIDWESKTAVLRIHTRSGTREYSVKEDAFHR